MKYKNCLIFLLIVLFLLSIGSVSATDEHDNLTAIDDNDIMEITDQDDDLSQNLEIDEDNVVSVSSGNFADLNRTINDNNFSEITLDKNYIFNSGEDFVFGIEINRSVTIDGQGHTLDANKNGRFFKVTSSGVIFKNIKFINTGLTLDEQLFHFNHGGAIDGSCKVINCEFSNNVLAGGNRFGSGGALYGSTAINCTFKQNYAAQTGGAMYGGTAINCTFVSNRAGGSGAMYGGTAINCTFELNCADVGGAVSSCNAVNCTFIRNSASKMDRGGGAMSGGSATNCTFISNSASDLGGAIYQTTAINCTFENNYARLGGAAYDSSVENSTFEGNYARINGYFVAYGGAMSDGIAKNCVFIKNHAANDGGAIYNGGAINCTFIENYAKNGGATIGTNAVNCTFINNTAAEKGGAMYRGNAGNCTFINNSATDGGAISGGRMVLCTFENNSATEGADDYSGTVKDNLTLSVPKSIYINYGDNIVLPVDLVFSNYKYNGFNLTLDLFRENVLLGHYNLTSGSSWQANLEDVGIYIANVSYESEGYIQTATCKITVNGIRTQINAEDISMLITEDRELVATLINASNTPLEGYDLIVSRKGVNEPYTTDGNGQIRIPLKDLDDGINVFEIAFQGKGIYEASNVIVDVNVEKLASKINASGISIMYGQKANLTATLIDANGNPLENYDVAVLINNQKIQLRTDSIGNITFEIPTLPGGSYQVIIAFNETAIYKSSSANVTLDIGKFNTNIVSSAVNAVYKDGKYLIATLKDGNSTPLANAKVTINLNGVNRVLTTDSLGQVKLAVSSLVPKKYSAKITFAGNDSHIASSANVNVVVKKAKPVISAKKKKTFKVKTKTKKYYITLKDNKKKVLKKTRVYLKVKGKTYKAKTNNKGKAVFKIKKLNKRGTFKAKITYKGNKYYYKVTKTVKIRVK